MSRIASSTVAALLLTLLAIPWASPIADLEAEDAVSPAARDVFTIPQEWQFVEGDFIDFDGEAFGLVFSSELESEDEFDRAMVNSIDPVHFEVLVDEGCDVNGTQVMCHVLSHSMSVNITAYNDTHQWQVDMEMGMQEMNFIHPDLNGWEMHTSTTHQQMWMRDQNTGSLFTEDESWHNETVIEMFTGIPAMIQEGDVWSEQSYSEITWTEESASGNSESGYDEEWTNSTMNATQHVQIELPPNEADTGAGGVTMDALLIETRDTDTGEFDELVALSEYNIPIRMYMEDLGGPKIDVIAWRILAQTVTIEDADDDGVRDADDLCPDTEVDAEVDVNGCAWAQLDDDADGVLNANDQCEGHDDSIDVDADGIIDGCDELIDSDGDGISDEADQCPGANDTIDADEDDIIDCLDALIDSDGDLVADEDDLCPGSDDRVDVDEDNIPDACDSLIDSDGDSVPDSEDVCPGARDDLDIDEDGIADGCDDLIDSDGDGISDYDDACHGHDDLIDLDADGIPDGCDALIDSDDDGVSDVEDNCPNTPDAEVSFTSGCSISQTDTDDDGVMDDADVCKRVPGGAYDANPMDGCPDDSDGDGYLDELDNCRDSKADVDIDSEGCEIIAEAEAEGTFSGTTGMVIIGIAVGVGLLLIGVLVMTVGRGGKR